METDTQLNNQPDTQPKQPSPLDWLDKELETLEKQKTFTGEKLPALQFEENKVTEFDVDLSEPWDEWEDQATNCTKAIIPCQRGEVKCIWWLNKKNPIYKDIVRSARDGQTHFKIMQTGTKAATKYNLVID